VSSTLAYTSGLAPKVSRAHRPHGADRRDAGARASGQKFIGGSGRRPAGVRVADVGGEDFEEADAGALASGGDERWHELG
jgi:hypothetical protein